MENLYWHRAVEAANKRINDGKQLAVAYLISVEVTPASLGQVSDPMQHAQVTNSSIRIRGMNIGVILGSVPFEPGPYDDMEELHVGITSHVARA